ncbi:MAG TPA: DUF2993 domain-containing protein, partial [Chthonomonadales bacterium]|nr:DUF2993 domain-containing protein [Chthonomonadales bacterium]
MPEVNGTYSLPEISAGSAQIELRQVALLPGVTLDELSIRSGALELKSCPPQGSAGDVTFRAVVSEANLNTAIRAALPPDSPVRNVSVAVLTGKLRFEGHLARMFSMPISMEAVPRIENGTIVALNWQAARLGVNLPAMVIDIVRQHLNHSLDLRALPIPIWLDEVRCEPGRVTLSGKAQIS